MITCPNCGSTDVVFQYDNIHQDKYHFHCKQCNLLRENVVSINHPVEEIVNK